MVRRGQSRCLITELASPAIPVSSLLSCATSTDELAGLISSPRCDFRGRRCLDKTSVPADGLELVTGSAPIVLDSSTPMDNFCPLGVVIRSSPHACLRHTSSFGDVTPSVLSCCLSSGWSGTSVVSALQPRSPAATISPASFGSHDFGGLFVSHSLSLSTCVIIGLLCRVF